MINITDFLKKTGYQIIVPFSKLKVFLQITAIIVIMSGFVILEGYNSLRIIGRMQEVSLQVFNDSVSGFDVVYGFKNEIKELQINYLKEISWGSQRSTATLANQNSYLSYLEQLDSGETNDMKAELVKVTALLQQPVSKQNYEKLNELLLNVNLGIRNLEGKVKNTATDSMNVGNDYFRGSTIYTVVVLFFSLLISLGLGLTVAISISKPLKIMANTAKLLAEGDLSKDVNARGCHEATVMVNGLNHALAGLRNLIRGIHKESETLLVESNNLREASSESGRAAHEVSVAMEELTKASLEQSNQMSQTVATVDELSELVQKVSSDTNNITFVSEKMAKSARLGQKVTAAVSDEINELYLSTKELVEVIQELNRTSGEIGEITDIIGGIGEQTTLLALNAAIEAARAGIHGKGFGVVAVETGKLAEQSKQSAMMITKLLTKMKIKTEQAVEAIKKGMDRVEAGKSLTSEATITFESIFKEQQDVLTQINIVAESARRMAEKSESVINAIGMVATISMENMAGTEEVDAVSEQQNVIAREVTDMAENLTEIANKLKKSITAFEID